MWRGVQCLSSTSEKSLLRGHCEGLLKSDRLRGMWTVIYELGARSETCRNSNVKDSNRFGGGPCLPQKNMKVGDINLKLLECVTDIGADPVGAILNAHFRESPNIKGNLQLHPELSLSFSAIYIQTFIY